MLFRSAVIIPIVFLGRRLRTLSRENQDWIAASSGNASEALLSAQAVQAFTQEHHASVRFDDVTERSFVAALNRIVTRAVMTSIIIFMIFGGIAVVLWIGAWDVRSGATSVGELVQFVIYSVMVAGSTAALSEIWGEVQRAAGATERLIELLNTVDTVADPAAPKAVPDMRAGRIEFDNVTFHYPSRPNTAALEGVTLTVEPGETVALVGPSGAGKSTIMQLLLRFFDPQSGAIRMGGVELRDLNHKVIEQCRPRRKCNWHACGHQEQ